MQQSPTFEEIKKLSEQPSVDPDAKRKVIIKGYLTKFPDGKHGERVADQILQVWNSGMVKGLFKNVGYLADVVLEMIKQHPKATISAQNVRQAMGMKPKFSQNIRPKL